MWVGRGGCGYGLVLGHATAIRKTEVVQKSNVICNT